MAYKLLFLSGSYQLLFSIILSGFMLSKANYYRREKHKTGMNAITPNVPPFLKVLERAVFYVPTVTGACVFGLLYMVLVSGRLLRNDLM